MLSRALLLACTLPLTQAADTILGVYIFSRHGDRTPKSTPPANLTELGYQEIFTSGTYFRNRYIAYNATSRIVGISPDLVALTQLSVSAPLDNVLMSSAQGFLQGLYPPVGPTLGSSTLPNGTTIQTPLNGYQLVPISTVTSGTGSEDSAWLQGATNCANALASSNEYFSTPEYTTLLNSTMDLYKSLTPLINGTFSPSQTSYKNAYTIWDLLNVASIHNASFTLPPSNLTLLSSLAATHEFALAYNASSPPRAIAGSTLAAQILSSLNASLTTPSHAPKLTIQFGAYGSFLSFFGLAGLPAVDPLFATIPDYASTMTFELFTATGQSQDARVRFLWHNGTTEAGSEPRAYPLFGGQATDLSWSDFASGMGKFAIGDQVDWCRMCGNTTGVCAGTATGVGPALAAGGDGAMGSSSGGMSLAVAGVIGAMVTLAVVLGVEGLVLLMGGLRVVSRKAVEREVGGGEVKA